MAVVAVLALYASFVNNKMKFGSDAIDYYRLAESISTGHGYTIGGHFVSKWPPVTPVMAALGMSLFRADLVGIKVLFSALALGGLFMAWLLLRQREEKELGAWGIGLSAVSFPFIYWVVDLSSEAPYIFCTMAAIYLGQRALDGEKKPYVAILAGVCIGLSFLTRTIGAASLLGFMLAASFLLVRERQMNVVKPVIVVLIPVLLLVGGWTLYSKQQGGESSVKTYGSYAFRPDIYDPTGKSSIGNTLNQIVKNAQGYAFIFSIPDASLRMEKVNRFTAKGMISLAIMLLAVIGFVGNLVKRPQFAEFYLLVYGGVLLVVNWYDIRYVVPVMPLLFYYVGWTIKRMTKPVVVNAVLALLVLASVGVSIASPPAKRLRSPEYQGFAKDFHDASIWIRNNAQKNDIVMSSAATMAWFWTRMDVKGIPLIKDPETMWQHIQANKTSMVIYYPNEFSGVDDKYLKPALVAHDAEIEKVKQFGKVIVYRLSSSPSKAQ